MKTDERKYLDSVAEQSRQGGLLVSIVSELSRIDEALVEDAEAIERLASQIRGLHYALAAVLGLLLAASLAIIVLAAGVVG